MHLIHTIAEAPANPLGVCALSACHSEPGTNVPTCNFLAYPGSSDRGEVYVYDVHSLRAVTMIAAHTSPLQALEFSASGHLLATASGKGSVFRVYSMPDAALLHTFRRGLKTYAQIFSMSFDMEGAVLVVSSDKATVHLFKLESPAGNGAAAPAQSWGSYLASTAASYLPEAAGGVLTQERSFAQMELPAAGSVNKCAILGRASSGAVDVLVASADGYLYRYTVRTLLHLSATSFTDVLVLALPRDVARVLYLLIFPLSHHLKFTRVRTT